MNATLEQRTRICTLVRWTVLIVTAMSGAGCSDDDDETLGLEGGGQTPEQRGQYLVDNVSVCSDCHTPRDADGVPIAAEYLSGAECFARLENGSCLNTRNLTNHETGLLNRSDDEIERMFTEGIRPTATGDVALFPVMPYYVFHNMEQADKDAIVAYLRTVPGVEHEVPRSGPEFELPAPANLLALESIPLPSEDYPEQASALRGRYLSSQAGVCMECHTHHVMGSPDVLELDKLFQGGEEFPIGLPVTPISKNLTSDPETGLGDWALEDIVRALKEGTDKDGDGICPPMPVGPMGNFAGLDPDDALDIAHFIKSLPPAVNAIDDVCTWPPM